MGRINVGGLGGSKAWLQQYDGTNALLKDPKGKPITVKVGEYVHNAFFDTFINDGGSGQIIPTITKATGSIDTVCTEFGSPVIYDKTIPTQVVNQAYSTQGNGGRKAIFDESTGYEYSLVYNGTTSLFVYERDDQGNKSLLYSRTDATTIQDCTIALTGDKLHVYYLRNNALGYIIRINKSDGLEELHTAIESSQTAVGNCSMETNSDGSKITATWASKNSTYPNSFNIRAIQGTISNGVVTWGSVEQITTMNTTNHD